MNVLVSGETLVDFLPESSGPLATVERFTRRAGGAPANVAVGLARLDETPWFWTRVGEDPFGDHLVEILDENDVPGRFIERDPVAKTSLAFVGGDTDRRFTFYRDGTADTRLRPGGVPDRILASVEWVYVGGVMLASEPGRSATVDLARRARANGCTILFDPNARPELWADGEFPDAVAEVLELADVVKATPDDLREAGFADDAPERLAEVVCERGPHTVLLTQGDAGSYARSTAEAPWGPDSVSHRGYDVDAVDATGAGDAFVAGALAAFVAGEQSLSAVLSFANAVAAVTTTATGAMAALPDRSAVERLAASD